ncbi:aldo/keto reductase [Myxococcaceae bacterium JPH2]|nr:aldo/keto reductase [Myxococcaceae bacterium JPH2]
MVQLGTSALNVSPLCLGGNVFGWTATEPQTFAVLDAYAAAGGNFVDTADVYSAWIPGNSGGESETLLGKWMASRHNRANVIVATKVGQLSGRKGLSAANIRAAAEDSLRRLKTDYIDLYYAHIDDGSPLEETLGAFDALVREGKVRALGASNYSAERLAQALEVSRRNGLARYVALQPHYNLMERAGFEGSLQSLCEREKLGTLPYFALAAGFLTGKYRPGQRVESARAERARAYLNPRGLRVLAALDEVASAQRTTVSAVALAWLRAQPSVASPIASARTVEQLQDLLPMLQLQLSAEQVRLLTEASAEP